MDFLLLRSMEDMHQLPETKWKIKQPPLEEPQPRENCLETGEQNISNDTRLGRSEYMNQKLVWMQVCSMQMSLIYVFAQSPQDVEDFTVRTSEHQGTFSSSACQWINMPESSSCIPIINI